MEFLKHQKDSERVLWQVLIEVFHSSPAFLNRVIHEKGESRKSLLSLFERPVNSLGQVPNNGRDMGGTPVYTEALGQPLTMCLEVPHASHEDQENFLSNPEKATHFNPVFVASEVINDSSCYEIEDSPFWILAQKNYGSEDVVYHETVLYELLGNSMLANVVFPEIPRSVFHPHKTLSDSRGRRARDWMDE
jgi:hypothetical protein